MISDIVGAQSKIIASYGNSDPITEPRYNKIEGSPYQFEVWLPGKIHHIEGEIIDHPLVNYNAENGKIEIKDKNGAVTIINEVVYHKVELMDNGKTYTFVNRVRTGDISYYKAIYRGEKLSFLEKMEKEIQKESSVDYSAFKYIGKFNKKSTTYILQDGQLSEVFRGKKKILDFFDSNALAKYVKAEKLNFKRNEDLAKAFKYMEENPNN